EPNDSVTRLHYSRDGNVLSLIGDDQMVRRFDRITGKELNKFSMSSAGVSYPQGLVEPHHVAFSPDGKLLASITSDEKVDVRDLATGKVVELLKLTDAEKEDFKAASLAFSPDGRALALAQKNGVIQLWDAKHGTRLRECPKQDELPAGVTWCIAFSPDSKTLA